MNDLIKIEEKDGKQTVNARELHEFLGNQRQFANWIQERIEKYDFIDGQDFLTIQLKSNGGRPSIDYYISLDMAKELSMVENNEKGKEARKYFIEIEKRYKNIIPLYFDKISSLELKIDKMATFIEKYNTEVFLPKQEETKLKKNCKQVMKMLQRVRNYGTLYMNEDVFFGYLPDFMTREEFKEASKQLEDEGEIEITVISNSDISPQYRVGTWSLFKLSINPYAGNDYK